MDSVARDDRIEPHKTKHVIKVVLMSLAFVLLGMSLGFASFYLMFLTHCGDLVEELEGRHKSSVEKLQFQYQQCVSESKNSTELEEIKGRLEAQTILKQQHQGVKEELIKVRNQDSMSNEQIQKLREQLHQVQNDLSRFKDERERERGEYQSQLEQISEQAKQASEQAKREQDKLKGKNQRQLQQISEQAMSLQDLQSNANESSQKVSELSALNLDLEKRLAEAQVGVEPFQKKIDEQAQELGELKEERTRLLEQESALAETIAKLKDDLKHETHEHIKCTEHLQAITTRENVLHRREQSAKDASASLPCVDEHDDCKSWASKGECTANPTYMNRFCRKTCKVCPQNDDDTETKWIDNEAVPTLDEKFASNK